MLTDLWTSANDLPALVIGERADSSTENLNSPRLNIQLFTRMIPQYMCLRRDATDERAFGGLTDGRKSIAESFEHSHRGR